MRLAGDRHDDFIQMPLIATSGRTLADLVGEDLAEFLPPLTHGLIRHADPTSRQHFLDHAEAQREPKVQPNRVADHFRRETMAAIESVTVSRHDCRLAASDLPSR